MSVGMQSCFLVLINSAHAKTKTSFNKSSMAQSVSDFATTLEFKKNKKIQMTHFTDDCSSWYRVVIYFFEGGCGYHHGYFIPKMAIARPDKVTPDI